MENNIPHLRKDSADGPYQYAGKDIVYFFDIQKDQHATLQGGYHQNRCPLRISGK